MIGEAVPLGPSSPGLAGTASGATVLAHSTGSTCVAALARGSIRRSETRFTLRRACSITMQRAAK